MKKKIVLLCLIGLSNLSYAAEEEYEGPARYRVFERQEIFDPIERGAYENLLRLVDEQNRKKGVFSEYLEKSRYKSHTEFDRVDFIPLAQFTGMPDKYQAELNSKKESSVRGYSSIPDLVEKKDKGLQEKGIFDKLSYSRAGNIKRFFFGKGNHAQDIIIAGTSNFNAKVEEAQKEKKDQYLLEGVYERPEARKRNQLSLSLKEYETLKGKSPEEQLQILAQKMNKSFHEKIEVKNGALYTKDKKGKEWKVLWSLEPVSETQISYGTTKKYYKDDIFTNIFIYTPIEETNDKKDSQGRILYTKDRDIIVEDKYVYGDVVNIGNLSEEKYKKDKEKLSADEFNKKWVTPFTAEGEFTKNMKEMQGEIEAILGKQEEMNRKKEEADKKMDEWKYSSEAPKDFRWDYAYETDSKKREEYVKNLKEEKDREFVKKWNEQEKIVKDNNVSYILEEKIPKKYGVYQGWKATEEEKKWLDRVIPNNEMTRRYLGKNIEFRGQGRIDGIVDLGGGNNELTIAEQFTGKYGTNIILGPRAILKNIAAVNVSGAIGDNAKSSLSGRTSLTLDIDPKLKNKEGRLVQHAFKDSDKNIVFRSTSSILTSDNRNDFSIELMASRIAEDAIVDMGRKLDYKAQDLHSPEKEVDMKINIISDSIAHTLSTKEELSKEGNSLLTVKVKDELKKFDKTENTVYASIKNSGQLHLLQPTLTTTNKKTLFQVADDDREEKKKIELIHAIRAEKAEDVLKKVSQYHLDDVKTKQAIEKIKRIASSKEVEELKKNVDELKKMENLAEYKRLNFDEKIKAIIQLNPEEVRQSLSQNTYKEEVIQQKMKEIKRILEDMDEATISKLAKDHPNMKNIKDIEQNLINLKEKIEKNPKDSRERQSLFSTLNSLKTHLENQTALSEKTLDKELVKYLESYNIDIKRDYLELKDILFYSIREEESFSEFKNLVEQLKDRNIYAKLNKIAKNEISTYTNFPFDIDHSLFEKETYTRGGFLSARSVQKNFKGSIYTGYGIYEGEYQDGLRLGAIVGGANTQYTETYSKTLRTVATESTTEGVSAYLGAYVNKSFSPKIEWITGLGLQYGFYQVKREMKNNYQELKSKGRANVGALNTYTGFVYSYPLVNDFILRGKGILSYSFLKQGEIKEKNGLNLDIASKTYHYVDGELGISLAKTFYDDSKKSTLSGGVSGVFGLSGYDNEPLKAKVHGSTSTFDIVGDKTKKDAMKLYLDYNMQIDTGFNYGLEGTYMTNKDQNDVKIGLKAGYKF